VRDLAREPKFGVSPAEDEFTQARPKWKTFAQRQPHTAQLASAVRLYGHLSLRGFGDLDIVICERDALRVRHLLIDGVTHLGGWTPAN